MPWCSSWMRLVLPRSVIRASWDTPRTSSARMPFPLRRLLRPSVPAGDADGKPASDRLGPRLGPQVDAGVHGVLVDGCELVVAEREVAERTYVLLELTDTARTDQHRGHPRVTQGPRERHLGQALATLLGELVQGADVGQRLLGEEFGRQRLV